MLGVSRRNVAGLVGVVVALGLGVPTASAQRYSGPVACSATIQSAGSGNSVVLSDTVSGSATVPSYAFVWVLTQTKGANKWWPQGGGPARIFGGTNSGNWSMHATFGAPQEAGKDFNIAAVPVDAATDTVLSDWSQNGAETGVYPGIALPKPAHGCNSSMITVRRVQ